MWLQCWLTMLIASSCCGGLSKSRNFCFEICPGHQNEAEYLNLHPVKAAAGVRLHDRAITLHQPAPTKTARSRLTAGASLPL